MNKTILMGLALTGAPLAWLIQVGFSTALASRACYPHDAPLSSPAWSPVSLAVIGIDAGCLLVALCATGLTWRAWRRTAAELKGASAHAIESGETKSGFFVMLSALSNAVFLVAIIVTGSAVFLVLPCRPF